MAALLFSLLALQPSDPAAPAGGSLSGIWDGPYGAKVELTHDGSQVVGRLRAETGACALPAGAEVLRGDLIDDSLGAQVRLCLLAPACAEQPGEALAILLVTRQLTGGVHTQAACAAQVRSLVLRRQGPPVALAAPPVGRLSAQPAPTPSQVSHQLQARAARAQRGPHGAQPGQAQLPREVAPVAVARAELAPGQIAGRPVGGEHGPGYDPRDARTSTTPRAEADRLLERGRALLATGAFEKARGLFREALQREPGRAEACNGVGVTYYARFDFDEALAWYKRALESDPRFGDAYYNMGCIYALQGRRQLALRYLKLAALNHYSERAQLEEDPDLESLRGDPELAAILQQMSGVDAQARSAGQGSP